MGGTAPESLRDPDAAGLFAAWRSGESHAGFVLADYVEERGNADGLPLHGFRRLAEANKIPFEDDALEGFPDEAATWRSGYEPSRRLSGPVWTWLRGDEDPWGLPYDVMRGFAAAYWPDEWSEEMHYDVNRGMVSPFGDPDRIVVSKTLRIVEVADFPLAVIVAALGFEVVAGLRAGAPNPKRRA